jgi:hypothetical protein
MITIAMRIRQIETFGSADQSNLCFVQPIAFNRAFVSFLILHVSFVNEPHSPVCLAGQANQLVESIAAQWRKISREGDVSEFLFTTELITHSLGRLNGVLQPSLGLSHKLRQFIQLLEDYDAELKSQGERKLSATVNSLIRRRPLVQFNSRVQNELKFVLGASGASTRGVTTVDPRWIRKRSLGRFTVSEGKDFWKSSFASIEMENVPWDRFVQSLQVSLQAKMDMSDERLLKHILDNDNILFPPRTDLDLHGLNFVILHMLEW